MADLKVETEGSATEKILAKTQTQFHADETFDDRKQKLKNYQQKLTDARQTQMMSFYALADEEKAQHEKVQEQRQQEFDKLMQ